MQEWIEIATFRENEKTLVEKKKKNLKDIAEDVALDPQKVIQVVSTQQGFSILVDSDFFNYCRGC